MRGAVAKGYEHAQSGATQQIRAHGKFKGRVFGNIGNAQARSAYRRRYDDGRDCERMRQSAQKSGRKRGVFIDVRVCARKAVARYADAKHTRFSSLSAAHDAVAPLHGGIL